MCTGAILLYRIPRVVIGENKSYMGGESLLRDHGVEVIVVDDEECKDLMKKFIWEKPEVSWNSTILHALDCPFAIFDSRHGTKISARLATNHSVPRGTS